MLKSLPNDRQVIQRKKAAFRAWVFVAGNGDVERRVGDVEVACGKVLEPKAEGERQILVLLSLQWLY
jgi:hypothetical protein